MENTLLLIHLNHTFVFYMILYGVYGFLLVLKIVSMYFKKRPQDGSVVFSSVDKVIVDLHQNGGYIIIFYMHQLNL